MRSLESTELARRCQTTTIRALSAEIHLFKYIRHGARPQCSGYMILGPVCGTLPRLRTSLAESLLNFLSRYCDSASPPTAHGSHLAQPASTRHHSSGRSAVW